MESKQVKDAAELEVRRYFDHFLKDIHPKIMKDHFNSCSHGKLLTKVKWTIVGMVIAMAFLLPVIGERLLTIIFRLKGIG